MFTKLTLIDLALGRAEANKVDLAIPQGVHDQMTQAARNDIAGWYYAPEVKLFGRLLTMTECWQQIVHKLREGKLYAFLGNDDDQSHNLGYMLVEWPCLRYHVERGEVIIREPKEGE
jgi:hypothetical protein